mmetsp:Transcript_13680/g.20135  ORF Transcript_13680/g.20135 Transcript_13680/m.20135 type:complete len:91 (+) Transcript_13680:385-657(+)
MVVGFIGLINFGDIISEPFHYLLHAYLVVFGYVAVVLEAAMSHTSRLTLLHSFVQWLLFAPLVFWHVQSRIDSKAHQQAYQTHAHVPKTT